MKYPVILLIMFILLATRLCNAAEITIGYEHDYYYPRVAYAFGPRDHQERSLLQILPQLVPHQGILDTLWERFADYDTSEVYDLLAQKDNRCLVSSLDRVVVQTFVFDMVRLWDRVRMDSIGEVRLHWKGSVLNRSGGSVSLLFGMYKGHVYGALRGGEGVDSVYADTTLYMCEGAFLRHWAPEVCHVTLTSQQSKDTSVICELQTDYLALNITYENSTRAASRMLFPVTGGEAETITRRGNRCFISYNLEKTSLVQITLFSPAGTVIRKFENRVNTAGRHTWEWDGCTAGGNKLSAGCYFIKMKTTNREKNYRYVVW